MSGIDKSTFQGHSTRSTSSSASRNLGVSIQEILDVGEWSKRTTFTKFRYKDTSRGEAGRKILSSR